MSNLLFPILVGFFLLTSLVPQTTFGQYQAYNPTLEEEFGWNNTRTNITPDDVQIIVHQMLDNSTYDIGEPIIVTPELINNGSNAVTINHYKMLFLTEVKYENGSKAWPKVPVGIVGEQPIYTDTLLPMGHFAGQSVYSGMDPIKLDVPGKYSVTSVALFSIYRNTTAPPNETVWSIPTQITVVPEFPLAVPVLLISIVLTIVLYRIKIRK